MGGKSTSQSAVLRSETNTRPVYDLRSWQGLTDVLRAAKQKLTPERHAAFRDLVLRYAQQGGDTSLKSEIDAVLATLDAPQEKELAPVDVPRAPEVSSKKPQSSSVSIGRRPVPQFAVRKPAPEPASAPTPVQTPPVVPEPQVFVSAPEPEPIPVPPPAEPEPTPVPQPKAPVVETPTPTIPEVPKPPVPPPAATPTPMVAEETFATPRSLEEHRARIIEIKRLVNEQIGNPVALVGAHKTLGREYMQALLTALKATGGGGTGADAAMRRLEDAYTALLTDSPETDTAVQPQIAEPMEAPAPVIETEVPITEPVAEIEKEVIIPTPPPEPPPSLPIVEVPEFVPTPKEKEMPLPVEVEETIPEPIPVPPPVEPKPIPKPPAPPIAIPRAEAVPKPKIEEPVQPVVAPTPIPPPPKKEAAVSPEIKVPDQDIATSKEIPKPPVALSPAARLAALTKDVNKSETPKSEPQPPQKVPAPAPKSAPGENAFQKTKYTQKKVGSVSIQTLAASGIDTDEHEVQQSELASPQITKALHELLHEWNIFNASGFLGMGPSGAEHPLYIRLAPLSMGEILTGRYEGADRKVNTVIHDYVNAWRHEQGIAYTPSETFEHYLRRVVQRIQKRQGTTA